MFMRKELLLSDLEDDATALSEEQKEIILSRFESREYYKGQLLLEEGKICRSLFFVKAGCLISYLTSASASEHIMSLAPEGRWITDMKSYLKERPSGLSIKAVETSEVLVLSRRERRLLLKDHPDLERYFRKLSEHSVVSYQQRIIERMSLQAEERFDRFIKRHSFLLPRLTYKQIASYIDVSPSSLSRILRKKGLSSRREKLLLQDTLSL